MNGRYARFDKELIKTNDGNRMDEIKAIGDFAEITEEGNFMYSWYKSKTEDDYKKINQVQKIIKRISDKKRLKN